ncbi:MAG: hypothetical protein ABJC89_11690, partial [Acidobacteriota bacterium]
MLKHLRTVAPLALACALTTACGASKEATGGPTTPTPTTISLDALAGTWITSRSATPAAGCGAVKYVVTPVSATAATIAFSATCAGTIQITGTGTGTVNDSGLDWTAQGLVSQSGVNCPFSFPNGKATQDAAGIKIVYSGTVCGIPVSGDE